MGGLGRSADQSKETGYSRARLLTHSCLVALWKDGAVALEYVFGLVGRSGGLDSARAEAGARRARRSMAERRRSRRSEAHRARGSHAQCLLDLKQNVSDVSRAAVSSSHASTFGGCASDLRPTPQTRVMPCIAEVTAANPDRVARFMARTIEVGGFQRRASAMAPGLVQASPQISNAQRPFSPIETKLMVARCKWYRRKWRKPDGSGNCSWALLCTPSKPGLFSIHCATSCPTLHKEPIHAHG